MGGVKFLIFAVKNKDDDKPRQIYYYYCLE